MIELKNITKKYGGRKALEDIDTFYSTRENNWSCRGKWEWEDDAFEIDCWVTDA